MKDIDIYILEKLLINNKFDKSIQVFGEPDYVVNSYDELHNVDKFILAKDIIEFIKKKQIDFPCNVYKGENSQEFDNKLIKYREIYYVDSNKFEMTDTFFAGENSCVLVIKEKNRSYKEIWVMVREAQVISYLILPKQ